MEDWNLLKKFIEDKINMKIFEIYNVELKKYGDCIGDIGKHYIVRVNSDVGKKTCYVNREMFDCYNSKINAVIVE